jgi:transposase-like protein
MSDNYTDGSEQCPHCGERLNKLGPSPLGPHNGPMRFECLNCQKVWTEPELKEQKNA